MSTLALSRAGRRVGTLRFLRQLGEMTTAMLLGMIAYGLLGGSLLALAGSSLEEARVEQPELFVLGMGAGMAVPMVAWMRRRGHSWRSGLEMSAAMIVPALVLIVCYRAGAITATSVCPLACAAMIPAMVVAMLVRVEHYVQA